MSISPKGSVPLRIQLILRHPRPDFVWAAGTYQVVIRGWVDRRSREETPNAESKPFSFHIPPSVAQMLDIIPEDKPFISYPVRVRGWE